MLKISNLTKEYSRGGKVFAAVSEVNLDIERGDFVNIIGRSGSGKTTLLNLMTGILSPTKGEIVLDGERIDSKDDALVSRFRNERIGYIPQLLTLLPTLSVIENVCLPFYLYKREGDVYGKAQVLLEKLGIGHLAGSYPKELSGGESRRVSIARALINNVDILIADEPTADLDIISTKDVMEFFARANSEGTTIVLVSHEPGTLDYGKTIYTMEAGKLLPGKHI